MSSSNGQSGWTYPLSNEAQQYPTVEQVDGHYNYVDQSGAIVQTVAVPQPHTQPHAQPHAQPQPVPQPEPVRYARPDDRRDPQRTALAAVITFICVIVALWAILGYMNSMAKTLSSVSTNTDRLLGQMSEANKGLASIDKKTSVVSGMAVDSKQLRSELEGIDTSMASMLTGVGRIGDKMQAMSGSLGQLDSELSTVNDINERMSGELQQINVGLGQQRSKVGMMRRDVQLTSKALKALPPRLNTTTSRLQHINKDICAKGKNGVTNNVETTIYVGPIRNGSAKINATLIPPGAWRC